MDPGTAKSFEKYSKLEWKLRQHIATWKLHSLSPSSDWTRDVEICPRAKGSYGSPTPIIVVYFLVPCHRTEQ
jgi:hypothetical protein